MSPSHPCPTADIPPLTSRHGHAGAAHVALALVLASMCAGIAPAAFAADRAPLAPAAAALARNPYGIVPATAAKAAVPIARDRASLATYPPDVLPAPEGIRLPAPGTSNPTTYPPPKGTITPTPPLPACGVVSDCSFEAGGVGWFGADITSPLFALGVYPAGNSPGFGFFTSAPTDGGLALLTGWDGSGPGDIVAFQDVVFQPNVSRLEFDCRAAWDLFTYGATLPRIFLVEIQPSGGGPVLQSTPVVFASVGSVTLDTGNFTAGVDVSAFGGQPVRVVFRWTVPEAFSGPAFFQLDRIKVYEADCLVINNCSFESGGFPAWTATDLVTPYYPLSVVGPGVSSLPGSFPSTPTDGGMAVFHGFDGAGPGDLTVHQDVGLPVGTYSLEFDYRAGWDMFNYPGSTLPRDFIVEIQPAGGGPVLQSSAILRASPGTVNLDTGPRKGLVDVSAFGGSAVRIVFRWHIPESLTGPGQFQLDHVTLSGAYCATIDNCSFETGSLPAWTVADMASPFIAAHVGVAGEVNGFGSFASLPTDGSYALIHGFDGDGPGQIVAIQDVTLPLWADHLRFDYRAAWDMLLVPTSTRPRFFSVEVQPGGGGPTLASDVVLMAPPATQNFDTGPRSRTLPVGALAGQNVRILFLWDIPESFTGPGFFQLDHVSLNASALDVGPGGGPRSLELQPAIPNPSREDATFRFVLPAPGAAQMEILDVRGARVWSEDRGALPAGEHRVVWEGRRSDGTLAPAGVYYARVRTALEGSTRMFVRVR